MTTDKKITLQQLSEFVEEAKKLINESDFNKELMPVVEAIYTAENKALWREIDEFNKEYIARAEEIKKESEKQIDEISTQLKKEIQRLQNELNKKVTEAKINTTVAMTPSNTVNVSLLPERLFHLSKGILW